MFKMFRVGLRAGLVATFMLSAGGCGEDDSGPKYTVREGTALDIDSDGKVRMEFMTDKGVPIIKTGDVADDAEIWIDGKQAMLEDVRKGDHVKATILIEGSKLDKRFIVKKIEVERAEFEPTGKPAATQPAATQPAATQPAATQPAATQPAATQPAKPADESKS